MLLLNSKSFYGNWAIYLLHTNKCHFIGHLGILTLTKVLIMARPKSVLFTNAQEGTCKNWNYLLEGRPRVVQASLLPEYSRCPSVSADQLALLWKAAFSFSEFFFKTFKVFAHFMMGDLRAHLPTPQWVFSSLWPKTAWPSCPTLHIHPISPRETFFFVSLDEKNVLKGKHFANVEEVKQNVAEALKGIKTNKLKKTFWAVEKMSQYVYCIQWRVLWRWLTFKHVKINIQFFINKFHFWRGPPSYA